MDMRAARIDDPAFAPLAAASATRHYCQKLFGTARVFTSVEDEAPSLIIASSLA
jgi:hypothetical protein